MSDYSKMIAQLEAQKAVLDRALSALREIQGSSPARAAAPAPAAAPASKKAAKAPKAGKKKRRLSAEGRERIIAAAKKRWAKVNAEKNKK